MKLKTFFFALVFLLIATNANAQSNSNLELVKPYRLFKEINNISINVPTTVEVPFTNEFIERNDFAVLDTTDNIFIPNYYKHEILSEFTPLSVSSLPQNVNINNIIDNNLTTYANFYLPQNSLGRIEILLSSSVPITSSALTILLDKNVSLPSSVEIKALIGGEYNTVVAPTRMDRQTINFPQTTSNAWTVVFNYSQPLRISEFRLNQENADKYNLKAIRFLAQPQHSYRIYFEPDRSSNIYVGESGNLSSAKDIFQLSSALTQNNPYYTIADIDNDGIPDINDNCVSLSNPDQKDINNNGRGDVCDDFDGDGVININDNCPDIPNYNQKDTDSDKIGDVCDKEESRITEKYPYLPWLGIGSAAIVLIILLFLTAKSMKINK